jgi:hypothetical protein
LGVVGFGFEMDSLGDLSGADDTYRSILQKKISKRK